MISLNRKEREIVNKNYAIINMFKSEFFPHQVLRKNDKLLLSFYFIAYSIFVKIDQQISTTDKDRCLQLFEEILIKTEHKSKLHSKTAINLYAYYVTRKTEHTTRKAFSYLHHIDETFFTPTMYYHLGVDLEAGINIKKNTIEAYRYYYKAAKENNYDAALNIALLIYADENVQSYLFKQDIDAMILSSKCLLAAADPKHGNLPEAQYVLALCYLRRENLLNIDKLSFYESICSGKDWLYLSCQQNYPTAKKYVSDIISNASKGEIHDLSDMPEHCILFILGEFYTILASLENFSDYFLKTVECYLLAIQHGMVKATKQLEICYRYLLNETSLHPIAERKYFLAHIFLSNTYKFIPEIQHISCQEALQTAIYYLQAATTLDYTPLTFYRRLIPGYSSDNNSMPSYFSEEDEAKNLTEEDKNRNDIYKLKQRLDPFFQTNYFLFKRNHNSFSKHKSSLLTNNSEENFNYSKPPGI